MTEEQPIPDPIPTEQSVQEEDYRDKYLRLLADMENSRKRMQKERQEMTRFAVENVVTEILGPIDNLENALNCAKTLSEEMRNWAQGFQMILEQFKDVLHQHGITAFTAEGEVFNPELHHAVESEETAAAPEGTILKEYVKGYRSKERTVRHARVKVAVKPKQEAQ